MKVSLRSVASVLRPLPPLRVAALLSCVLWCGAGFLAPDIASAEQVVITAVPDVVAPTSTLITRRQAWLGGNVIADNGDAVTERGIVYSPLTVNGNPEIGGTGVVQVVTSGTMGVFSALVSGLQPGTTYRFKAYATNLTGTGYTPAGTFTTVSAERLTLYGFGDDAQGVLGHGLRIKQVPESPVGGTFISAGMGDGFGVAVRSDGTVWSWGANDRGRTGQSTTSGSTKVPTVISGFTGVQSVEVGPTFVVALKGDGTLWSWGSNSEGELGIGTTVDATTPQQIGSASNWVRVSVGAAHVLALNQLGELWVWGDGDSHRLGLGDTTDRLQPTRVGTATTWARISAGTSSSLAVQTDGTLWAWGSHEGFQTGLGTDTGSQATPTRVTLDTDWQTVYAGDRMGFAIRTSGQLWAWGVNTDGRLGLGGVASAATPSRVGSDATWSSVSATVMSYGSTTVLGTKSDGSLWAWGLNGGALAGSLGYGSSPLTPTRLFSDRTVLMATHRGGSSAAVLVRTDGTLEVWGDDGNVYGLGLGDPRYLAGPTQIGVSADWISIAAGGSHSLGVRADGSLWQWGALSSGPGRSVSLPTRVGVATDWSLVVAARFSRSYLGLKRNGELWVWGTSAARGLLGGAADEVLAAPVRLGTALWKSVAASGSHVLGVRMDGTLWAWGANLGYQFGTGTTSGSYTVTQVGTSNQWAMVAASRTYSEGVLDETSFGIRTDGTLWTWGANADGMTGRGTTSGYTTTPTQIGVGSTWRDISGGYRHVLAVTTTGELWGWGANYSGQLGDGTSDNQTTPVRIGSGTTWVSADAGFNTSSGVTSDGRLWTWGLDDNGASGRTLAPGSTLTPTQVGTGTQWQESALGTGSGFALALTGAATAEGAPTVSGATATGVTMSSATLSSTVTSQGTSAMTARGVVLALSSVTTAPALGGDGVTQLPVGGTTGALSAEATGLLVGQSYSFRAYATNSTGTAYSESGSFITRSNDAALSDLSVTPGTLTPSFEPEVLSYSVVTSTTSMTVTPVTRHAGATMTVNGTTSASGASTVVSLSAGSRAATIVVTPESGSARTYMVVARQLPDITSPTATAVAGSTATLGGTLTAEPWDPVAERGVVVTPTANSSAPTVGGQGVLRFPLAGGTVGAFTVAVTGLTHATAYSFRAYAINAAGTAYSSAGTFTTVDPPTLTSPTSARIGRLQAWLGGTVTAQGVGAISERGVVYSMTSANATPAIGGIGVTKVARTGTTGAFETLVTGLQSNTTYSFRAYATNADGTNYTSVGTFTTLANPTLRAYAFGDDPDGGSGLGRRARQEPAYLSLGSTIVAVGSGQRFAIALGSDGRVWSWGSNANGRTGQGTNTGETKTPTVVSGLSNVTSISVGTDFALAIRGDGTLWAWGEGANGRLGRGSTTDAFSPVQVGSATNWTRVSAGDTHVLAVNSLGELWAWGGNVNRQIGDGTSTDALSPVRIGTASTWRSVSAGRTSSMAVQVDGSLWAWGASTSYQLGNNSLSTQWSPVRVNLEADWQDVFAGGESTFATKTDGSLWAWGANTGGRLGMLHTTTLRVPTRVGSDTGWASVELPVATSAYRRVVARKADGSLWLLGESGGPVGASLGVSPLRLAPTRLFSGATFSAVSHRGDTNVAAVVNAAGAAGIWGLDETVASTPPGSYYVFGQGDPIFTVTPTPIETRSDWAMVATGHTHSVGIRADGSLWQWGATSQPSDSGGRGTGYPVRISNTADWAMVVTTSTPAYFALKKNGELWRWGNSASNGLMGTGSATSAVLVPTRLGTDLWKSVAAGGAIVLAVRMDGQLWAWGSNDRNQLGNSGTTASYVPIRIGDATDWALVAAMRTTGNPTWYEAGFALKTDGSLWSWGNNTDYRTGQNTNAGNTVTPTRVGTASNWESISTGRSVVFALNTSDELWSWGSGASYALGDGTISDATVPRRLGTASNWTRASAGRLTSAGVRSDGTLWTWGSNEAGLTGRSLTGSTTTPTQLTVAGVTGWRSVDVTNTFVVALADGNAATVAGGPSLGPISSGSVADTTATLSGEVTSEGGSAVTQRGIVLIRTAVTSAPQLTDAGVVVLASAGTTGTFSVSATGLTPGEFYSFRAFATNAAGTNYSEPAAFMTIANDPSLDELLVDTADLSPTFSPSVISYHGVVAANSVTVTPTARLSTSTITVNGTPIASEATSGAIALSASARTVQVQVTAHSGDQRQYTVVLRRLAALTSTAASSVTATSAVLGGNVTDAYWDSVTERGVVLVPASLGAEPIIGGQGVTRLTSTGGTGSYSATATGLQSSTTYAARSYAISAAGVSYAATTQSFTTLTLPTVVSPTSTDLTTTSATLGGTVSSAGSNAVTVRGVVYSLTSTNAAPVIGGNGVTNVASGSDGTGAFTVAVSGLTSGSQYSFAAYATTAAGTSYSAVSTFTTVSVIATLSSLVVSAGPITPVFSSTVSGYSLSVGSSVTTVTVTPTATQANATVRVRIGGGAYTQVTSGTASPSYTLGLGANLIDVWVVAQDGVNEQTYTVTVTQVALPTVINTAASSVTQSGFTAGAEANGVAMTRRGFVLAAGAAGEPAVTDTGVQLRLAFPWTDVFTAQGDPSAVPTGVAYGAAWSADGTYLSVAHATTPFLTVYKRVGPQLQPLAAPATLPTGTGRASAWSADGTYLAVAHDVSPFVTIYRRSGDTLTKLADPDMLPADNASAVSWSPSGTYLTVGHATSPFVTTYRRSGDSFTKVADPDVLPTGNVEGVSWDISGTLLAVAHATTPFLTVYSRSEEVFTKLADPSTLPTGTGTDVAWSPDGLYLAVAHSASPRLTVYRRDGTTLTKLTNPTTLPAGNGAGLSWSVDSLSLAVAHATSPFVSLYRRSGDALTKLSDPAVLPTGAGLGAAWSPDGQWVVVTTDTPPFLRAYVRGTGTLANGAYSATYEGLSSTTSYRLRSFAENAAGLAYGPTITVTTTAPPPPTVASPTATSVKVTTATLGGTVTSAGGGSVTARGVVYAPTTDNASPAIDDPGVVVAPAGSGTGLFNTPVTGLTEATQYSMRAYATNAYGTGYSSVRTFTTQSTTSTLSALTLSAGTLSPSFASLTTSYTANVSFATATMTVTPTVTQPGATVQVKVGSGSFTDVSSGTASGDLSLQPGLNTITVRVLAEDQLTSRDYTVSVTRRAPPTVTTPTSASITATGATLGGNITATGGSSLTERGVIYALTSANADPLIGGTDVVKIVASGTSTGVFTTAVTGLSTASGYSFKAYAINGEGTGYSPVATFSTPSTVATLSALTLSVGTLTPGFTSGVYSYTASVSRETATLTLTPTVTAAGATVGVRLGTTGAFTPVTSGSASEPFTLASGANTFQLQVLAPDGVTTQIYEVVVTQRARPTVTSPTTTSITATSARLGGNVTADGNASVTDRGIVLSLTSTNPDPIVNGNGVTKIAADSAGLGIFSKVVTGLTAASGYSFKAYAINTEGASYSPVATFTTRSTIATLSALTLSSGSLSPSFTSGGFSYTASVASTVETLSLTPTATMAGATIGVRLGTSGDFTPVTSGDASGTFVLAAGPNTLQILVTATDEETTQLYSVVVTKRAAPTVTSPTSASITATGATLGGNVTADGGSAITERGVVYALTATNNDPVINGTGVTKVTADTASTGVFTKAVTGLTSASGYSFKAYAINAEGTTYSTVATFSTLSTVATLNALTISAGTLTPAFASGTTSYTASVATGTTTLTLTPTVTAAGATVGVRQGTTGAFTPVPSGSATDPFTLSLGANTFELQVTAPDGATTQVYSVVVTRRAAPTVTSPTSSSITATGATLGGNVTADGGSAITERGVVYALTATNNDPLINGTGVTRVVADTAATGVFTKAVTGLTSASGYSFKAYAINAEGTTYSAMGNFTTAAGEASLSALTLSSGVLSPAFSGAQTSYTATVRHLVDAVTVTPTASQAGATTRVRRGTGGFVIVPSGSPSGSLTLDAGTTILEVQVTSQDETSQRSYTITVTRPTALEELSQYDGSGAAPEVALYVAAGVTGVTSGNLGSMNSALAVLVPAASDSVGEVQAMVDGYLAVLSAAAGSGGLSLAQLQAIGITGATADNLQAVRSAIAATADDGSGVDTFAELQQVVTTAANDALAALALLRDYAGSAPIPSTQTYVTAGVSGVLDGNRDAMNSALAVIGPLASDTVVEIQAIVDAFLGILAEANGAAPDLTPGVNPTVEQYALVGATVAGGLTARELALMNDSVGAQETTAVDTVAKLNALAAAAARVLATAAGGSPSPVLSVADLSRLRIDDATIDNMPAVRNAIALTADDGTGVDTMAELQSVVTTAATEAAAALLVLSQYAGLAPVPELRHFEKAGVSGVTDAETLTTMNSSLAVLSPAATDTTTEVQAMVSAYLLILAEANGSDPDPTPDTPLQAATYDAVGAVGAAVLPSVGLSLINDVVGANERDAVDTVAELEGLADVVSRVLATAAGEAPSPALSLSDFVRLRVTGVTGETLMAVREALAATSDDGGDVDQLVKLQAVVDAGLQSAAAALAQLRDYAGGTPAPAVATFRTAGVVNVDSGNITSMNSALAVLSAAATDTVAEVQAMVEAYRRILEEANGDAADATPGSNPTVETYAAVGARVASELTPSGLRLANEAIGVGMSTAVDTVDEIETLAASAARVMATASGVAAVPALSVEDLVRFRVSDVSADNLAVVRAAIASTPDDGTGVDTLAELQAVVQSTAAAGITLSGPSTGAAHAPLTLVAQVVDALGRPTVVTSDTQFLLSTDAVRGSFAPASPMTIARGMGRAELIYQSGQTGTQTVRMLWMVPSGAPDTPGRAPGALQLSIHKGDQRITFTPIPTQGLGSHTVTVDVQATSGMAVLLTSQTGAVCQVAGRAVSLLAEGVCTLRATQAGDDTWDPATPVDASFAVRTPTIEWERSRSTMLPAGAPMSVGLTVVPATMPWTAASDAAWLSTTSGGTGSGSVQFSAQPNTGFTTRTATVMVGGTAHTVSQAPTRQLRLRVAEVRGRIVTLQWTYEGPEPTGFVLEGDVVPGGRTFVVPMGRSQLFTVEVGPGRYYARVRLEEDTQRALLSNEVTVLVGQPLAPSAPANLVALPDGDRLSLNWLNTYEGGEPASLSLVVSGSVATTIPMALDQHADFSGVPSGQYTLQLRADNASGVSTLSAPVTVSVPDACAVPNAPEWVSAGVATGGVVSLRWGPASSGPAASAYVVNAEGLGVFPMGSARSVSGTLGPGTYRVTVQALSRCGTSAPSLVQTIVVP